MHPAIAIRKCSYWLCGLELESSFFMFRLIPTPCTSVVDGFIDYSMMFLPIPLPHMVRADENRKRMLRISALKDLNLLKSRYQRIFLSGVSVFCNAALWQGTLTPDHQRCRCSQASSFRDPWRSPTAERRPLAGTLRFGRRLTDSKSAVLPLNYVPI